MLWAIDSWDTEDAIIKMMDKAGNVVGEVSATYVHGHNAAPTRF
jgi:hypothetical protein